MEGNTKSFRLIQKIKTSFSRQSTERCELFDYMQNHWSNDPAMVESLKSAGRKVDVSDTDVS